MPTQEFPIIKKSRGRPPGKSKPATIAAQIPVETVDKITRYIDRHPDPKPSRPEAIGQLVDLGLAADEEHRRATPASEAIESAAKARALKLAKAVRDGDVESLEALPSENTISKDATPSKRAAAAGRAKELAVGAVKQALAKVDAPDEVKLERKRKLVAPPATEKIRTRK